MEMSGEDYRALMDEKFKNVHETIDRNYKEQQEDRQQDTKMVLGKIDEVLGAVETLRQIQDSTKNHIKRVESETSGWRFLQTAFKKKPVLTMSTVLFLWYIISMPSVKEFINKLVFD